MAAYCFCGCGRKVRFAKKKMSERGARAAWTLGVLEHYSLRLTQDEPVEQRKIQRLVEDGQSIPEMYAGIIHDEVPAPPISQQTYIWEWEATAERLAKSHWRMIERHKAIFGMIEAAHPEFAEMERQLDAMLGTQNPADEIVNLRRWRQQHAEPGETPPDS